MMAGPALLEPIHGGRYVIPEEFMGAVSGDLNARRGRTMGMEVKGKMQVLKANVPWRKCSLMPTTCAR
jgi:elongation factor G